MADDGDGMSMQEAEAVAVDDVGDMGAHHGGCCGYLPLSLLWVPLLVVISNCVGEESRWEVCTRS